MEEEKIETPVQPTKFVKSEPPVAQKPQAERKLGFGKLWFIPVILALVAVILVSALWVTNRNLLAPRLLLAPTLTPTPTPTATPAAKVDEDTVALEEQGTSDEISEIEADLNATDLTEIDKELTDIENELASP